MEPETLARIRETLELIDGWCTTLHADIETRIVAADDRNDEEYDYHAANDAQDYLARIKEETAEARGQWWAS